MTDPRDHNGDGRVDLGEHLFWLAGYPARKLWDRHPGVRTGPQLSAGERAADRMRNGMGSWAFVFGSLAFLGVWTVANKTVAHFDAYPFILLNLLLSCIAALQGAILLIAAKRSDQVASELAQHDYEADCRSRELLEKLATEFEALKQQHNELHTQMAALAGTRTQP